MSQNESNSNYTDRSAYIVKVLSLSRQKTNSAYYLSEKVSISVKLYASVYSVTKVSRKSEPKKFN